MADSARASRTATAPTTPALWSKLADAGLDRHHLRRGSTAAWDWAGGNGGGDRGDGPRAAAGTVLLDRFLAGARAAGCRADGTTILPPICRGDKRADARAARSRARWDADGVAMQHADGRLDRREAVRARRGVADFMLVRARCGRDWRLSRRRCEGDGVTDRAHAVDRSHAPAVRGELRRHRRWRLLAHGDAAQALSTARSTSRPSRW